MRHRVAQIQDSKPQALLNLKQLYFWYLGRNLIMLLSRRLSLSPGFFHICLPRAIDSEGKNLVELRVDRRRGKRAAVALWTRGPLVFRVAFRLRAESCWFRRGQLFVKFFRLLIESFKTIIEYPNQSVGKLCYTVFMRDVITPVENMC